MRTFLSAVAFASVLLMGQASAQDYNFTVPVRIENMRHIETAHVSCTVDGYHGTRTLPVGASSASTTVPLVDGTYRGTVNLSVTLPDGINRSDFRGWYCSILYFWTRPDGRPATRGGYSTSDENALYQSETGQAIVSSRVVARSTFP